MNKTAQQQVAIEFKQREINKSVSDALTDLNKKMQMATKQLSDQVEKELANIVNNLKGEVNQKVNEIKSLMPDTTTTVTQTAKDKISGGKGDELDEDDVDKEELKKGIKVELEHTDDEDLAEEIAIDHLAEDPEYYTNLAKVHKESFDLPGVVKEGKKKKKKKQEHPTPRGKEHTKDLPEFWRQNFDYGESPYMNLGFIDKITDKPPYKKKKKKSEFLAELIAIADRLDKNGFYEEADKIDELINEKD